MFQLLQSFPLACIYALIDEQSNGIFIHFSDCNAISQLALTVTQLRRGIHDCIKLQDAYNRGSLEFKLLKDYGDNPPAEFLIRADVYEFYNTLGYTDMRNDYIAANYRLKCRIINDRSGDARVFVLGISRGRTEIVLGIFESMGDADSWIDEIYPGERDKVGIVPRFALNERTREYHVEYGYKLQRKKLS